MFKITVIIILVLFYANFSWADLTSEGNKLFKKGNYEEAIEKYSSALNKNPESDIVNFNLGTALYKKSDFTSSIDHLQKALLTDDKNLKTKAQYNLGNAFYQLASTKEDQNVDQAIEDLERSIDYYQQVIKVNSEEKSAQYNLDVAKKKLEELKKKKESQQQQKQEQKQEKDKNQQQDKQDQQNNSDQSDPKQQQKSSENKDQQSQESDSNAKKEDQENNKQSDQNKEGNESKAVTGDAQKDDSKEGLNKEQSAIILENYQQNEEPKQMFPFYKGEDRSTTLKDW